MKSVKTPKGTTLPLVSLKGKDYLMTAYRLQWFVEENPMYHIHEQFLTLNDEETIAQVTIQVLNEQGQVVRKAMGVKRETKEGFPDHTEKAATGALGRALIQLGYGTQYALADLDEGNRLADSPLPDPKSTSTVETVESPKKSSFRKTAKKEPEPSIVSGGTEKNGEDGSGGEWMS